MKKNSLFTGLDTNQFHTGLDEICSHFRDKRFDEYLNGLAQEVESANASLFGVMNIASVRRSIQQESRLLNERIVAVSRYIDSCFYVAKDAAPVVLPRRILKREAAAKQESLVDYLKAMVVKDVVAYV